MARDRARGNKVVFMISLLKRTFLLVYIVGEDMLVNVIKKLELVLLV